MWLASSYGMQAPALAATLSRNGAACTEAEAARILGAFFDTMPGLWRERKQAEREARDSGVVTLWTGRRNHLTGTEVRSAWNRLIQGGAAEMVRVATQRAEAPLAALDAHLAMNVYDELVVECPESAVAEAAAVLRTACTEGFDFWLRPRISLQRGANYHTLRAVE